MRPKLRGDTLYVPAPAGTYLMNNQKALTVPGQETYRWIERLAPYLDGQRTLDELTTGLPADKQGVVSDLVRFLLDQGFATDVAGDRPHGLTRDEEQTYAAELAFIGYFQDSAGRRFEHFRNSSVLVAGSGRTLASLVQAGLHCGVAELHVAAAGDGPAEMALHERYAQAARERDPRQALVHREPPDWEREAAVRALVREYEVVVHAADQPFLARAEMINRACLAEAKTSLQAVVLGDQAWAGPLVSPAGSAGCWECAWRRAWPRLSGAPFELRDQPHAEPSAFLTGPPAALVASHLIFEVFKSLTGAGPLDTAGGMVQIDLETLRTRNHRLVPHPLCSQGHRETLTAAVRPAPSDEDGFGARAAALFDDMLGVFSELSERDFTQAPLKVSEVMFPDPGASSRRPVVVHGAGHTVKQARLRAVRRACELYAAALPGPRQRSLAQAGAEHVLPVSADCDDRWGWVQASNLAGDQPVLVPAVAALPALAGSADPAAVLGLASGYSAAEAACRGLARQAAGLAIAEFTGPGSPAPRVDLATVSDDTAARLRRTLAAARHQYAVYDVTGVLGAPAFAFGSGTRTVAWISDLDVTAALTAGLEQIILDLQAVSSGQEDYRPVAPDLPAARRGQQPAQVRATTTAPSWDHQLRTWCDLFLRQGLRPVAVPLDHDPAVTAALPNVVNVLLVPHA